MIRLRDVTVWYEGASAPALLNVSLEIKEGEFVLVLGRSGSGKSTLGKVIAGIVPHVENGKVTGLIDVAGIDPRAVPLHETCKVAMYIAQSPYDQVLFSRVEDEVRFTIENVRGVADSNEVTCYLSLLGLEKLRDRKVTELSGGQLQKLVIACALAVGSRVIIFDEPFAHLDAESAHDLRRVFRLLCQELRRTVVLIEHRFREVAELIDEGLITKVVLLSKGEIARVLSPDELYRNVKLLETFSIRVPVNVKIASMFDAEIRSFRDVSSLERILTLIRHSIRTEAVRGVIDSDGACPVVELRSVYAGYKRGGRSVTWTLKDINLRFTSGRVYSIIGRNGSGKSTLLLTIIGSVPHVRGKVLVLGKPVRGVQSVTGLVSYVPQNPDLVLTASTVREELMLRARIWARSEREAENTVREIVKRLGLEDVLHRNPHALSRGQRFRVALAAALAQNTPVMLLDEPTSGQDEECMIVLGDTLREEAERGKTVILVTHDLDFVHDYADKVIALSDGRVIAQGSPVDVLGNSEIMRACGLPTCPIAEIMYRCGVNLRQRELLSLVESTLRAEITRSC